MLAVHVKSSEFRAILWLICPKTDHIRIGYGQAANLAMLRCLKATRAHERVEPRCAEWVKSAHSPQKGSQEPDRIRANNPHDRDEFHDVKAALPALVFGHERLRLAQALCDVMLGEACLLAGRNHEFAKGILPRRVDGFVYAARARCHRRSKLIPASDYPK
jgi:hypothetical protein